jgi:hypothetical protein
MRFVLPLVFLAALGGGCGAEESAGTGDRPRAENGLVLKVEHLRDGGVADLTVAVYADGRVFRPDPRILIYPGPVLTTFSVARVPTDRVAQVVAAVRELDPEPASGEPGAGVTVVTVVTESQTRSVRLPDGSDEAARLGTAVADLPITGEQRYRPHAVAVLAQPAKHVEPGPEGIAVAPRAALLEWPLVRLRPGCSVVSGPDVAPVLAAAQSANELSRWRSGGSLYTVAFRPLLPGESSCDDIAS